MWSLSFFLFKLVLIVAVESHLELDPPTHNNAFDLNLYKDVLDPEECARQLAYVNNNDTMLKMQFLDAGARFPRGFLTGNMRDMGNYFQCLGIKKEVENMSVEGKYCVMHVPLQQDDIQLPSLPEIGPGIPWPNITWPNITWPESDSNLEEVIKDHISFNHIRRGMGIIFGDNQEKSYSRVSEGNPLSAIRFELAICIPKVCTVKNAVDSLTPSFLGTLNVEEAGCRLPDDKPWVAADTIAVVLFSLIGLLTLLSTGYDVTHSVILERDPKQANTLYTTFSVFTNSRKFFTFHTAPNAITCLDGIRSMAMMWVIVGHTFSTQPSFVPANILDMVNFMTAFSSLWIMSAPITVDTFFMISGLLLVYTTASKMSRMGLLKNLHLFYLNRLLRMFPVLATAVLMQAAFLNRITDGPYWYVNAQNTNNCRQYWWTTLLYVQNLVNPLNMCLPHTWYLAIDMQMYIISPIILFWVLGGNKRSAWIALAGALMTILTASTIYNFLMEFQSSIIALSVHDEEDPMRYMRDYYLHTLPRASPFFVGMVFGYAMHLCKGKSIRIPKPLVAFLWTVAVAISTVIFIAPYFTMQADWDNQNIDSILNSFMRPAWSASIAWLVFACAKGYGGPINWFLSLDIFKILGRLSYAMYILHYPLMFVISGTTLAPIYFSVEYTMHRFLIDFAVAVIAAYIMTVTIDLPFSRLIGMVLGGKKDGKILDIKKNDELRKNEDDAGFDVADLKKQTLENGSNARI